MLVVQGGEQRVSHERGLVPLVDVDQSFFYGLPVVVPDCESVCLVLQPPDQVHHCEVDDAAHGHVQLGEEEEVQEVGLVGKAEGLDNASVAKSKCEAGEEDCQRHTLHKQMHEHVSVNHVAKLMVHDGYDLLQGMLSDQSVKQNDLSETPEASHEGV